jgi:hypothetical protein
VLAQLALGVDDRLFVLAAGEFREQGARWSVALEPVPTLERIRWPRGLVTASRNPTQGGFACAASS